MKSEIQKLVAEFQAIYQGPNWTEVSLEDALAGVDSNLAFSSPPGGRNTIAQIVCHLVFYRKYLIQKLQGNQTVVIDQDESFNTAAYGSNPETAWPHLRRELEASFQEIKQKLEAADAGLLERTAQPRSYNFDYLITGIIQHEAYHTGQLELLKKQLQQLLVTEKQHASNG